MSNEVLTTKDQLRNWLNAGNTITVLEATIILRTVDLRQYITQLRREGLPITDEWQTNEQTKKRFKKYWLVKPEPGQQKLNLQ